MFPSVGRICVFFHLSRHINLGVLNRVFVFKVTYQMCVEGSFGFSTTWNAQLAHFPSVIYKLSSLK